MVTKKTEYNLQERLKEATTSILNSARREYRKKMDYVIDTIFSEDDIKKILTGTQRIDKLLSYVKSAYGREEPRGGERERRWEQRQALIKKLEDYSLSDIIPKEELKKRTGLKLRQLFGYTLGNDSVLIKVDPLHYKINPKNKERPKDLKKKKGRTS
ncbi:MAG: hypothetical protein ABIH63_01765 [archaeon]